VIPHQTKKVKNHHHYMIRHSHLLSLVVESLGQINQLHHLLWATPTNSSQTDNQHKDYSRLDNRQVWCR